jgi:hypothetical protein
VITCADVDAVAKPADLARPSAVAKPPDVPWLEHAAGETLRQLFSPRVDLSQTDIHSLDGQNLSGRDSLRGVLE